LSIPTDFPSNGQLQSCPTSTTESMGDSKRHLHRELTETFKHI